MHSVTADGPLRILLVEESTRTHPTPALPDGELTESVVQIAASLDEALGRLSESRYDVILADVSHPDAAALGIVRAMRDAYPGTPLRVLTGRFGDALALRGLAEGVQDKLVTCDDESRVASALLHAVRQHRAEQDSYRYLQLAHGVLDALESPTCAVTSAGEIVAVNEAWREFATANGGNLEECGVGSNYLRACDQGAATPNESGGGARVARGLRAVLAGRLPTFQLEYPCHGPGAERWFSVRIAPAEIDDTHGAVISHVDVTAMHDVQQSLSYQALHDPLTRLPNRQLLIERLDRALAASGPRAADVGVAVLDLDDFQRINKSFGHTAGDVVLRQIAERLTSVLRPTDTVARLSGDEFGFMWHRVDSAAMATSLGARLVEAMAAPFLVGKTLVTVSASIGVSTTATIHTGEGLVQAADTAMYDAKQHSRGRVRMFSAELRRGVEQRMSIEVDLRAALARNEFVLHYQPVIELGTGTPVGVEALVRWQHPNLGLVGPVDFIPVAEASGLIAPLGAWVLDQACGDAASFSGAAEGLTIAVNLSARQLTQPDVVTHVRNALAHSGLSPLRLLLELTETAVMEDEDVAWTTLNALSDLGIRIAIDDFGTGYSSLLQLRRGPFSALKLDRAFVSGVSESLADRAICASVVHLAHTLGAESIAEGVETPKQLAALRAFGCQLGQGFLWSPAVPLADLDRVLLGCSTVPMELTTQRTAPLQRLDPDQPDVPPEAARQAAAVSTAESIAASAAAEVAADAATTAEAAVSVAYLAAAAARLKASQVAAEAVLAANAAAEAVTLGSPRPRYSPAPAVTTSTSTEPESLDVRDVAAATAEATVIAAAAAVTKIALALASATAVAAEAAAEAAVLVRGQLDCDIAAAALAVSMRPLD
jgi:diguanylate cyclase (GGDEF)-like protein